MTGFEACDPLTPRRWAGADRLHCNAFDKCQVRCLCVMRIRRLKFGHCRGHWLDISALVSPAIG